MNIFLYKCKIDFLNNLYTFINVYHCDNIESTYMSTVNIIKLNINRTIVIPKLKKVKIKTFTI